MSVNNFLNDFYVENTGQAPTEEMVTRITQQYGDNYDGLINDLAIEIGGAKEVNTDIINKIKTQYNLMSVNNTPNTPDTPVKKKGETITTQEDVMVSDSNGEEDIISSDSLEVQPTTDTDPPNKAFGRVSDKDVYVSESSPEVKFNPIYKGQQPSTHLMRAEQLENGDWVGFPSLMQDKNGDWINMSYLPDEDWEQIYKKADELGEVVNFGSDKESALAYGEGSWKESYNKGEHSESLYEKKIAADTKKLLQEQSDAIEEEAKERQEREDSRMEITNTVGYDDGPGSTFGMYKIEIPEYTDLADPKRDYAASVIGELYEGTLGLNDDGSLIMPTPNQMMGGDNIFYYGPQEATAMIQAFSEDGFFGDDKWTLKQMYENNPVNNYMQAQYNNGAQSYGSIDGYMRSKYPGYNSIADTHKEYEGGNYGIKDWDNISEDDANFIRMKFNSRAGDLTINSANTADKNNAYLRAGLYDLKTDITYEVTKLNALNQDLLYNNYTMAAIPLEELSKNEKKQYEENMRKMLALTADYNMVNQEWANLQEPDLRMYNPFTNQLIDASNPNSQLIGNYNDKIDEEAAKLAIEKNPKELQEAFDVNYQHVMNLAKKIKLNYKYNKPVTHNGVTYQKGDVIDRTNLQVVAEWMGEMGGVNEYEDLAMNPLALVSGQPTEDLIDMFPDPEAVVASAGFPMITSNTEIAMEYNRAIYELAVINTALKENRDPSKLQKGESIVTGSLIGSGRVKNNGTLDYVYNNMDEGDNELPFYVSTLAEMDKTLPETARFLNRVNEGFWSTLYGDATGEYLFGNVYNQASYLSTALDKVGLEGSYIDDLRTRSQPDNIDFAGGLTGTVFGIVLEFGGAQGLLKAPAAIAEGVMATELLTVGGATEKVTRGLTYTNIDKVFGSAYELNRLKLISGGSPYTIFGSNVVLRSMQGGIEFGTTGLVLDKTDEYRWRDGLAFGAGYGIYSEMGALISRSPSYQKISQKVNDFKYSYTPSVGVYKKPSILQRIKQGGIGTAQATTKVAGSAAIGTGISYAIELFDETISPDDPLMAEQLNNLPEEIQGNSKALTTFYTFAGLGLLNKSLGKQLMTDIKGLKPFDVSFNHFFRSQEAYRAWKNKQGTPQGMKLLTEGAKDVMENGTPEQKQNLKNQEAISSYNNGLTEAKNEIYKYDKKVEDYNNSISVVNSVNNNPSKKPNNIPVKPVPNAQGDGEIEVPDNGTEEGNLQNIENIISTPSKDLENAAKGEVKDGNISEENGMNGINAVQDVLATNSKVKGIQNTKVRARAVQALQTKKELQRELDKLNEDHKNGVVANFEAEKKNLEEKIKNVDQQITEIESYEETEADYVTDLIKNKDRRNHDVSGPGIPGLKEKYPKLAEFLQQKHAEGMTPVEALKEYQKQPPEVTEVESKAEVVEGEGGAPVSGKQDLPTASTEQSAETTQESNQNVEEVVQETAQETVVKPSKFTWDPIQEAFVESTPPETLEVSVSGTFDGLRTQGKETMDLRGDARGKDGEIIETKNKEGETVLTLVKETYDAQGRPGYVGVSVTLPEGSTKTADDVRAELENQMNKLTNGEDISGKSFSNINDLNPSAVDKNVEFKTQEDAIQEPSAESVPVQESPGDSEAVVESVPEPEVAPEKVEVEEKIEVEETPKEEVIEAEVVEEPVVDNKEPRQPGKVEQPPKRGSQIDQDLDAVINSGTKGEALLRQNLEAKGYRKDQIDRAIRRKDREALVELKNLKKDLQLQGKANKKYTVKATDEFKKQLKDVIDRLAGDRNIKFTKGELNKILEAATGTEMQGLKVEKAIEKAVEVVEKSVKRSLNNNINDLLKLKNVEKKQGKRKVGKISIDSRRQFNDLRDEWKKINPKDLTIGEMEAIETELSSLIYEGKLAVEPAQRIIRDTRRSVKGQVNESLYSDQTPKTDFKNGVPDVEAYLKDNTNNFVIINGRQVSSVSGLNDFIKDNPFVDVSQAKGYVATTPAEAAQAGRPSILSGLKYWTLDNWQTIRNTTAKLRGRGGKAVHKNVTSLIDNIYRSEYREIVGKHQTREYVRSQIKDIPGYSNNKLARIEFKNYLTNSAPSNITTSKNLDITNDQAVYMYLLGKRDGVKRLEDNKIDPLALSNYIENNPALKTWASKVAKIFGQYGYDRYNERYEVITGKPMPKASGEITASMEGDPTSVYIPIQINPDVAPVDPFGEKGEDAQYSGLNVLSAHLLEKTSDRGATKIIGTMDAMDRYFTTMEHMSAFYDVAQQYNNIFNPQARPQMINILGRGGSNKLDKIMEVLNEGITGNRRVTIGDRDKIDKTITQIGRFPVFWGLAGKTKTMIGQASSGVAYPKEFLKYLTPKELVGGYMNVGKGLIGKGASVAQQLGIKKPTDKRILEEDTFFLEKWVTDPQFADRWNKNKIDPLFQIQDVGGGKDLWDRAANVLLLGVKTGDMMALQMGVGGTNALYHKYINEGMSKEDAYDKAAGIYYMITQEAQQTGSRLGLPDYLNNRFSRAGITFTTSINSIMNKGVGGGKEFYYRGKDMTGGEKLHALTDLGFYTTVLSGVFLSLVGQDDEREKEIEMLKTRYPNTFDDNQATTKKNISFGLDLIQSDLQGLGPVGVVGNMFLNSDAINPFDFHRGKPQSFSELPLTSAAKKVYNAMDVMTNAKGETYEEKYNSLSDYEKYQVDAAYGAFGKFMERMEKAGKGEVSLIDFIMERDEDYGLTRRRMEEMDGDKILDWVYYMYTGIRPPQEAIGGNAGTGSTYKKTESKSTYETKSNYDEGSTYGN